MATLTTSWVTYASASFSTGPATIKFSLQARYTSQSVNNNTTAVQTRLRSDYTKGGSTAGAGYKYTCSYASTISGSGVWTFENEVIMSGSSTITHNTDGSKTITISATAYNKYWGVNKSMSASVSLPKINRKATVTSGNDFGIDSSGINSITNNPTIKFSNPANYQLQPYLEIYNGSTKVETITRPKGTYTSPYNFNLTQNERDTFLQTQTTSYIYSVREGVTTYNGNTSLGSSYVTQTMHVVGHPRGTFSYQDTNPTTLAITGDNQKIIQNQSTLQIDVSNIQIYQNASISNAKATYNGTTYNGTISGNTATIPIGTINSSSDIEIWSSIQDTRGAVDSTDVDVTMLSWELPTANISLARQNNYYSETDIKVDANYSSLDGNNVITIKERHKKKSEQTYSAYTTLTDNVTTTLTLDNLYEWDVQVLVQDLFGSTTYDLTLDKGMPIIYFDRIKRSVGINCFPQNNESLEIDGKKVLIPYLLYDNSNGSNATITLDDNVSNYSFLEIFYGWGFYGHASTKYDTSSSDGIDLSLSLFNNNRLYFTATHLTANGNQLVVDGGEYWSIATSGSPSRSSNANRNYIYKVIGYK